MACPQGLKVEKTARKPANSDDVIVICRFRREVISVEAQGCIHKELHLAGAGASRIRLFQTRVHSCACRQHARTECIRGAKEVSPSPPFAKIFRPTVCFRRHPRRCTIDLHIRTCNFEYANHRALQFHTVPLVNLGYSVCDRI